MKAKLRDELERWRREALGSRRSAPESRDRVDRSGELAGGERPADLYTPLDLGDYLRDVGFPGEPPFTRGLYPAMYRERRWTMRQYAGFGTAEESNQRFRYLLSAGQTGLSVAFDLPTQMGRDSDHPIARGEVGRVGVAIDSLEDMERLFDGIPLDRVSTSMTINATAAILLALYVALAERRGVAAEKLRGTVQNDVLKEYVARGTYIYPPRPSLRIVTDLFGWAGRKVPAWNTISVSGYHMREAGSDAVQEVAFTLANGLEYVEAARAAGLDPESVGAQISFFFNVHNHFLEEVAKFRAARRLWARLVEERFHVTSPRARSLRFHAQTAGATLTAQQPLNNAVRVAWQAMAAVLGGAQSLHTNSYDEALSLPSEQAVTLALRTQQILAEETGVAEFVDPLGGSYAVEALTSRIEAAAHELVLRVDALGGMVAAIEQGFVQKQIESSAYAYQLSIERAERFVVGVNRYASESAPAKTPSFRVDPRLEQEQVARLDALRARRDAQRAASCLNLVERAAKDGTNLMDPILDAVRALCTVGEISDAMRRVFGEYKDAAKP